MAYIFLPGWYWVTWAGSTILKWQRHYGHSNQYAVYLPPYCIWRGRDSIAAQKQVGLFWTWNQTGKASRKIEDLRDPYANYHKMAILI